MIEIFDIGSVQRRRCMYSLRLSVPCSGDCVGIDPIKTSLATMEQA